MELAKYFWIVIVLIVILLIVLHPCRKTKVLAKLIRRIIIKHEKGSRRIPIPEDLKKVLEEGIVDRYAIAKYGEFTDTYNLSIQLKLPTMLSKLHREIIWELRRLGFKSSAEIRNRDLSWIKLSRSRTDGKYLVCFRRFVRKDRRGKTSNVLLISVSAANKAKNNNTKPNSALLDRGV